jgi:hypothetical protein
MDMAGWRENGASSSLTVEEEQLPVETKRREKRVRD